MPLSMISSHKKASILKEHGYIAQQTFVDELMPGLFFETILTYIKENDTPLNIKIFKEQLSTHLSPSMFAHIIKSLQKVGYSHDLLTLWFSNHQAKLLQACQIALSNDNPRDHAHDSGQMLALTIQQHHQCDAILNFITPHLSLTEQFSLMTLAEKPIQQLQQAPVFGLSHVDPILRDIYTLKSILLQSKERLEENQLSNLYNALEEDDKRHSILKIMFETIPNHKWPHLFFFFHTEIVCWNLLDPELLDGLFDGLSNVSQMSWLDDIALWSQIVITTLENISRNEYEYFDQLSYIGAFAKRQIEISLKIIEHHKAGFTDELFRHHLKHGDISLLMPVLFSMKNGQRHCEDRSVRFIMTDEKISSWLPTQSHDRTLLLSQLFFLPHNHIYDRSIFSQQPYIRSSEELKLLIQHLHNRYPEKTVEVLLPYFPQLTRQQLATYLLETKVNDVLSHGDPIVVLESFWRVVNELNQSDGVQAIRTISPAVDEKVIAMLELVSPETVNSCDTKSLMHNCLSALTQVFGRHQIQALCSKNSILETICHAMLNKRSSNSISQCSNTMYGSPLPLTDEAKLEQAPPCNL